MKRIEKSWSIEVFNGFYDQYGGHWQFLSRLTHLDYLCVGLRFDQFSWFRYFHTWYDGQHHSITLLWLQVSWGGPPYSDV